MEITLKISLKYAPKFRINNIPALVHIIAWRLPDDKPLSEPVMFSLPTHVCVSRPQWVKPQVMYIARHLQYVTAKGDVVFVYTRARFTSIAFKLSIGAGPNEIHILLKLKGGPQAPVAVTWHFLNTRCSVIWLDYRWLLVCNHGDCTKHIIDKPNFLHMDHWTRVWYSKCVDCQRLSI